MEGTDEAAEMEETHEAAEMEETHEAVKMRRPRQRYSYLMMDHMFVPSH